MNTCQGQEFFILWACYNRYLGGYYACQPTALDPKLKKFVNEYLCAFITDDRVTSSESQASCRSNTSALVSLKIL